MDIVEFAEKIMGLDLLVYQKKLLRLYSKLPKDSKIVMGRRGPILLDKDGNVVENVGGNVWKMLN